MWVSMSQGHFFCRRSWSPTQPHDVVEWFERPNCKYTARYKVANVVQLRKVDRRLLVQDKSRCLPCWDWCPPNFYLHNICWRSTYKYDCSLRPLRKQSECWYREDVNDVCLLEWALQKSSEFLPVSHRPSIRFALIQSSPSEYLYKGICLERGLEENRIKT